MKKPRRMKSVDAAALRKECADLRYISVFVDLPSQSPAQMRALLDRTQKALDGIELLVFAHDDSNERLAFATIGVAGAAYAIATLSGVGSIIAAVIGGGVAIRDAAKLVETRIRLQQDEELFLVLGKFHDQLAAEYIRRGYKCP